MKSNSGLNKPIMSESFLLHVFVRVNQIKYYCLTSFMLFLPLKSKLSTYELCFVIDESNRDKCKYYRIRCKNVLFYKLKII